MSNQQRILITGNQGFIGKALTRALRHAGNEVWGINRSGGSDAFTVQANLLDQQMTQVAMSAMPTFAAVIHCAALAHGQDPPVGESVITVNTKMTENIFNTLDESSARFIFLSSIAVYGEDRRHEPVSVHDDVRPATEYGRSKLISEKHLVHSDLQSLDILRLAPVFDKTHMNDVRKRTFFPGPFKVKMRLLPPPRYSLCHIDTVVKTILDLLSKPANKKRIFNIADATPYPQDEILSFFPGKTTLVPVAMTLPLYWLATLLGKRGYAIRCLYWKLFRSNIYVIEAKTVEP